MNDRHPLRTWPEGTEPPADAFVEWIRAHDPAQLPAAVEVVARILEVAHRGQVCLMADHERYPEALHHLHAQLAAAYRQADRFRAAWRSARRRGVWRLQTSDGAANTCRHDSASGVDTTSLADPAKVWRCDHCGLRWTQGEPERQVDR